MKQFKIIFILQNITKMPLLKKKKKQMMRMLDVRVGMGIQRSDMQFGTAASKINKTLKKW